MTRSTGADEPAPPSEVAGPERAAAADAAVPPAEPAARPEPADAADSPDDAAHEVAAPQPTPSGAATTTSAGPDTDAPKDAEGTPAAGAARSPAARYALAAAKELGIVVGLAVVLSLVVKTFIAQAFFIPSPSMTNTLLVGDRVLVNKLVPGPFALHRGDVVVFSDPGTWLEPTPQDGNPVGTAVQSVLSFIGLLPQTSDNHLIKRVIGLPGDTVTCCDAAGRLQVNGVAVQEPYLYPGEVPSEVPFSVTVKPGHLWVMGDHRSVSDDSRFHRQQDDGQVPIDDVVGQAFAVVWPLDRMGGLGGGKAVFAGVPAARTSP